MKRLAVLLTLYACAGELRAHEPGTFEWNDTAYRVVLASEDTGKAIGIFWSQTKAPGGPPLHIHDDATETFYVLDGRTRFVVGGEEIVVEQGQTAFVPRGVEHTYRVLDENGGTQLTILAPGGFEHFFAAVAAEGLTIPEDMPRINEIAAEFNLRFTGPPLPPTPITPPMPPDEASAADEADVAER